MRININLIVFIFLAIAGCATQQKFDIETLKKKADTGDAIAMFKLGAAYDYGMGTNPDKSEATKWYLKSAELGNPEAQNSIGSMYQAGDGVDKNIQKAFAWYQKAANAGHAEATNNLAFLYDSGLLGKIDKKKSIELYTQAAERGHIPSFYNLGLSYLNGDGVSISKIESYKWFDLARLYTQGTYPTNSKEHRLKWMVRGHLDKLKQDLNPQQIEQAQSLGAAWIQNLKK